MSLSQEQILELQEIGKLPVEEQKVKLSEFMSTLSPEQVEFLKKQQCLFCGIANGRIDSKKIYEDDKVVAVLDINPGNKGHCLVFPKEHFNKLDEFDVGHLFNVVSKLNKKIKEVVGSEGSNVFVADGEVAGQRFDHVVVHVIPRFKDDGVVFRWEGKEVSEEELNELVSEIKIDKVENGLTVDVEKEEEMEEVKEDEEEVKIP